MQSFEFEFEYENGDLTLSHASQEDIDTFPFHEYKDAHTLSIYGDFFHKLRIPDGIKNAIIVSRALRELHVPDSMEYLNATDNCLYELELPGNIGMVRASNCYLARITFRSPPLKLGSLIINRNRLASLDFEAPNCLEYLDIRNNKGEITMHESVLRVHNAMLPDEYMD